MNKIRLGLIGTGGIAKAHLQLLPQYEDVELVAACDVVKERAEEVVAAYGGEAYADVDEMLSGEKMDALFVCVPPFAHGDIEEKAASKGIHMLVEKPMGLDVDTVKRKAEAIDKAGILTATGYVLRYTSSVLKAKELLQDKQIAMIRGQMLGGFVQTPWWRQYAKSGGQLVEMTTHNIDAIRYIAGDMSSVYANMALIGADQYEGCDIPGVTSMSFMMKSGAVGHMDTSYLAPVRSETTEFLCKDYKLILHQNSVEVIEKDQTVIYDVPTRDEMFQQDRTFFNAILSGDKSKIRSDYFDAAKTMEATIAANLSWETGQRITLSL